MIDYLAAFPIPAALVPERLRELLEPVGTNPATRVEVSSHTDRDIYGPANETVQMLMAVVPDDGRPLPVLHSDQGLVAHSTPVIGAKGSQQDFVPNVCGHDYIVASWGSGSFSSYHLAEKVWMALGLTARSIGNEHQCLIYDDLDLPEFGVAQGEISSQYYFQSSRDVRWFMSNEYLRKYLWLRGGRGVRQFYYQATLADTPELQAFMKGEDIFVLEVAGEWCDGEIQKTDDAYLLQVWATVEAVSCELCPDQTAEGLEWPGVAGGVTRAVANGLFHAESVYLDDRFLERYEQNSLYDTTPVRMYERWNCSPSYLGQWAFSDCKRVGRNLIKVQIRELYKGMPDREILHAHRHVVDPAIVAQRDLDEEHIVSKVSRLLDQWLELGDNLSRLAAILDIEKSPEEITGFSRREVQDNGWLHYPRLSKLAQTAPLEMSQQDFLARCKSIHEFWQKLPDGFLRKILVAAGVPQKRISNLASLKLLQALQIVLARLDENEEASAAFRSDAEPEGWDARGKAVSMLFLTNDLRIADAHEVAGGIFEQMQNQGFDTATLNQGYGKALDFVFDGVIKAFASINQPLGSILARG
ncbi:hypothetical protein ABXK61_13175 [Burkholderia sola]|uniref:hypothetical protein n=1 Tax=Burkholderia TaxID=32008 RepID=UPI001FD826ED|nr:hypothetical protein [Burkholderia sp. AcTa6-5]